MTLLQQALLIAFVVGAVAALAWPGYGGVARWNHLRKLARRRLQEDALKHILKQEARGRIPSLEGVAGALHLDANRAARLLQDLEAQGLATCARGKLSLEDRGRELALHIVRAHRLWERHLAENTGVAETRWHGEAELREHELTPDQTRALSAALGNPTHDPHGDIIPGTSDHLQEDPDWSINLAEVDSVMRIIHVEDEPESIYRQVTALGLRPGMLVRVLEKSHQGIRLWAEGSVHTLPTVVANNIAAVPVSDVSPAPLPGERHLADLRPGVSAQVAGLSPACRGQERRRLLDLGFVPGTSIAVEMAGPGGDPTAYRLRGTLIALRKEQAALVRITSPSLLPA